MKEKKQLNRCKGIFVVVVYLRLPICVKKQCFQLLLFFFISIRGINCCMLDKFCSVVSLFPVLCRYVICLLCYSSHFIHLGGNLYK